MTLEEAIVAMIDENGAIYFDRTEGWYEEALDFRSGGEDIEYLKRDDKYYKNYTYVEDGIINRIKKASIEVTIEEIAEELLKSNVTAEEVMTGAMLNRGFWTNKSLEIDG